jgi:beta-phosphoglucomutase family hydrolase
MIAMPAAVIFDMDGTLVATTEADFLAWQRLFSTYGRSLTFEEYFPLLGKKSSDVVHHVLGLHGHEATGAMHKKMMFFEEIVREKGIDMMPNAEQLLKALQAEHIPIALATSSRVMKMKLVMKTADLDKYFNAVVTGEEVTVGKPGPDIFLLAAKRLNVDPVQCVVIEDAASGVAAAKAAGMKCVAVTNTHHERDLHQADLVVDDLSELSLSRISGLFAGHKI